MVSASDRQVGNLPHLGEQFGKRRFPFAQHGVINRRVIEHPAIVGGDFRAARARFSIPAAARSAVGQSTAIVRRSRRSRSIRPLRAGGRGFPQSTPGRPAYWPAPAAATRSSSRIQGLAGGRTTSTTPPPAARFLPPCRTGRRNRQLHQQDSADHKWSRGEGREKRREGRSTLPRRVRYRRAYLSAFRSSALGEARSAFCSRSETPSSTIDIPTVPRVASTPIRIPEPTSILRAGPAVSRNSQIAKPIKKSPRAIASTPIARRKRVTERITHAYH